MSILNDGVAEIPIASANDLGVIKTSISAGIVTNTNGIAMIRKAQPADIKLGTNNYLPIVPNNQHESAFYGLAKAAGDTTQSQSDNAIG